MLIDELLKIYARLTGPMLLSGEDNKILSYVRTRLAREVDAMSLMKQAQAQAVGQTAEPFSGKNALLKSNTKS